MKMTKILITCLVATFLCACSSNAVPLSYNPSLKASAANANTKPVIAPVETVVDRRGHDANWLGAIRGGFGNPIKTLTT